MPDRRKYYVVAYGNQIRWAGPCNGLRAAAIEAWGMLDTDRMTVREVPGNPKRIPHYKKTLFLNSLAERHFEKTGNSIQR